MVWLFLMALVLLPHKLQKTEALSHVIREAIDEKLFFTSAADGSDKPEATPTNRADERSTVWWQRPEWISVYLTASYNLVSLGTLYVIWKQNRSIQNTDRAVLIPMWQNFVHLTPEGEGRRHTFQVNFQNFGKTPAFIRGHQCNITLISNISELPRRPKYRSEVVYKGDPLVSDAVTERAFYSLLDGELDFDDISDEYRIKGKTLYAFGFIR